jgi:hypothetical protein
MSKLYRAMDSEKRAYELGMAISDVSVSLERLDGLLKSWDSEKIDEARAALDKLRARVEEAI